MSAERPRPPLGRVRADEPVLVVGLGRFGEGTADELVRLGRDVMAIESDADIVQAWADRVTHVAQADARSIDALRQLGAEEFAVAVVGVGSSIEASVLITANLVDLGIPQIWAKAISRAHGTILERIGANHVIYPEAEAGERAAHLVTGRLLDFLRFDDDFAIVKMHPPQALLGRPLGELGLRRRFGITVIGSKSHGEPFEYATKDTVIDEHGIVILSGPGAALERFAAQD